MGQERQRSQEEGKIQQGKVGSSSYNRIHYKCRFACIFSLLYLACMVLHVVLFYCGMGFLRCNSVFSLALEFLDSHGVMGFACFG